MEENIKEALTNVAKHSNVTKITVSILIFNMFYRVEIRDNGNGFEKLSKGLGLRGIEERVQEINSRVEAVKVIESKTDTKCLILTTFDEDDYINEAMEYGAKGYILKNSTPEQIAQSILQFIEILL